MGSFMKTRANIEQKMHLYLERVRGHQNESESKVLPLTSREVKAGRTLNSDGTDGRQQSESAMVAKLLKPWTKNMAQLLNNIPSNNPMIKRSTCNPPSNLKLDLKHNLAFGPSCLSFISPCMPCDYHKKKVRVHNHNPPLFSTHALI